MKKILLGFGVLVFAVSLLTFFNVNGFQQGGVENVSALKFKQEYEDLNNEGGNNFLPVEIDENNKVVYSDYNEIMSLLKDKTGVIYFGRPNCPWSRIAAPVLVDAANDTGIDKIYYFNATAIRDEKRLSDEGNIIIDKEGTKEYYALVDRLSSVLGPYKGLNDESIKRLYFPTVIFVKDGEIVAHHIGTVESQSNPNIKLTNIEENQLKQIYINGINKILDSTCSINRASC